MEVDKSQPIKTAEFGFSLANAYDKAQPRSQWRWLVSGMVFVDIVMIYAGFMLAYVIRFNLNLPFFYSNAEGDIVFSFYLFMGLVLIPIWVLTFFLYGLYQPKNHLYGPQLYSKLFNATTIGIFVVIVINFLVPTFILARGWLLLMWGFVYLLTATGRLLVKQIVYRQRAKGNLLVPAIIVGANEEAILLAKQFRNGYASGLELMGFISDDISVGTKVMDDLFVLGSVSTLESITREIGIEEVIVSSSAVTSEDTLEIFKLFGLTNDVNLRLSSGLYEIITTGLQVQELSSVPLVKVNQIRLTGLDQLLKFLLDITFSLGSMVFVIPLTLILGILIKLDSKGPIFHRRRVMGVQGKSFDAFKFRTMYVNGDEILEQYPALKKQLDRDHKLKDDPRVTRVGRFIRKYSLDEFPQFFNVLRREMSVVGPRMISPKEMHEYQQNGMNLLTVKPGITGLWQVSGRSDVTYKERVQLDMYYIRNWSIWMDFRLIFKTIPAMISRRGAY